MHGTDVLLGLEAPALQEQVLHFLDRVPGLRVVAAVGEPDRLARAVRDARPDAAVVGPGALRAAGDLDGAALFVVDERETTEGLRLAIRSGARGFYLWPEERDQLARDARGAGRPPEGAGRAPGRAVGVVAARGGAGATFLATNLAAACASRGAGATFLATNLAAACASRGAATALADLDLLYADVTAALGIAPNGHRTVADLAPVADEIGAEHLDRVLYRHPRGFRVLLAPPDPSEAASLRPSQVAAAIRALRGSFDVVVAHAPRGMDASTVAALEEADEILVVVTLDVLAFRDAKRLLAFLGRHGLEDRCRLVVNRASRDEIVPQDAERVFGLPPVAVLGRDPAVPRAQNRGHLIAGRSGRLARRLSALADLAMEGRR